MTQKTIELASVDQAQELVVAEGTIATYDAAQGPLLVASLVNHGTLRITSSDPALQEAEIAVNSLTNFGDIQCDLDQLTIKTAKIRGLSKGGRFIAPQTILLKSDGDLKANGGIYQADVLQIVSGGKVGVHAYRIDAKVKVKAKEVAVGANDGNLEIVEQCIDSDPLYYQGKDTNGGNMTITVMNQPGEDVSLWAVGNITVNGAINTLGGDAQHPGRITIQGGCQKVAYNDVENDGRVECIDCALPFPGLEVITTPLASNTSVITLGNLSGKAVNVIGGTIIAADVVVDNENNPDAGQCSFTAATSVKVGNITTTRRDGAGVRKGGMNAFAKDIDIGNVDGAVLLLSDQSGLIKVGNVNADFGAIQIKAGQDFGGGGGGLVGGAAIASFTTLNASIQTGTLKSQSSILLMANGNIGTGTITLDPNPFSGPSSPSIPHDVRVHANINKETSPAFLAGGGGTNGTGQITVNNRAYVSHDQKSGVIAITNGPNGDVHLNGTRLKCLTGDKGTPGIVVDAGSGQVRLVGGSPLSVDGSASQDAGFIVLQGGELRAPNAAVISASDTKGSAEDEAPIVLLAVDKITLPGSLTVNCNGNTGTSVKLAPKGSFGADIVHIDYTTPITPQGFSPVVHEVAVTGAGSMTVTANSKNGSILCSGDPLRFANNGTTHIESEGDGSMIELKFAGSPSGQDSLIFTGGAVEVTADNPQHNGGTIMVTADKVKNTAPSVAMHANALADGNGGTISLDIDRGNLSLGTTTGTMSLTCTGMGSGAGGNISVENAKHNGTITLDPTFSTAALNVAALGSNGDGGHIDLHADHLVNNATGGNSGLVANGVGTGNGGHIGLRLTDSITIGGAPGLFVTAISTGSGNGGDIDIVSTQGSVTINGANVSANGGSDGRGGNITAKTLQADATLTVDGLLTANGQATRRGGHIKLVAASVLSIATAHFEAKGGTRGAGGTVELIAESDLTVEGGQINASSGTLGSNQGGKIVISTSGEGTAALTALQSTGVLTLTGDIDVSGKGSAEGGDIQIVSGGALDLSGATLKADGGPSGNGGSISLQLAGNARVKILSATGGNTDQLGGEITIENRQAGLWNIDVEGRLDTSAGAMLSGTTEIIPSSDDDDVEIRVLSGGGAFTSYLSARAKNITFLATPVVQLGIDDLRAFEEVLISLPTGTPAFVSLRDIQSRIEADSTVEIVTSSLINNRGRILGTSVSIFGQEEDLTVTSSGTLQTTASGATRGFVTIFTTGALTLDGDGVIDGAKVVIDGGEVNINAPQHLLADNPSSAVEANITLGGGLTAIVAVAPNVTVRALPAEEGGNPIVVVNCQQFHNAGTVIVQSPDGRIRLTSPSATVQADGTGTLDATNIDVTCEGNTTVEQGNVLATNSTSGVPLVNPLPTAQVTNLTFIANNGDFAVGRTTFEQGEVFFRATAGNVQIPNGQIISTHGNITMLAGQSLVLVGGGGLTTSITAAGGDVTIAIGPVAVPTNNNKPENVTVIPETAEDQVFWGAQSITVFGTAEENEIDISGAGRVIFDTNGHPQGSIQVGPGFMISAG